MDIPAFLDPPHLIRNDFKIRSPVDCSQNRSVCRLDTDLQLYQAGPQAIQKVNLLLIQKVCRDLKMKIRNAIILFFQETEKFFCPGMIHIKGPVHKFHLGNPMFQKKCQFLFHTRKTSEAHPLVNRRKTITAGKRAASATFIIDDPVLKFCHIFIDKGKVIQFFVFPDAGMTELSLLITVNQSPDVRKSSFSVIPGLKFPKSRLTFACHNSPDIRFPLQNLFTVIRDLRTAQPNLRVRQNLFQILQE